jgi:hypothetical protein
MEVEKYMSIWSILLLEKHSYKNIAIPIGCPICSMVKNWTRRRMKEDSDTPLGTYDIPDKDMWNSGGNRKSYGANPRLILNGESGEIKDSKRDLIRIHGGRQEIYNDETGTWEKVKNPELKKTNGCMRAFDVDVKKLKSITDNLKKNDKQEFGGKLTVVADLVQQDGKFEVPEPKKVNILKFELAPIVQRPSVDNVFVKKK